MGTNKVVVVVVVVERETLHTWMIFYFLYSRQYLKKFVKWGSGSLDFYLLVRVISS